MLIHLEEAATTPAEEPSLATSVAPGSLTAIWRQALLLVVVSSLAVAFIASLAAWTLMRPEPPPVVRFSVAPDAAVPFIAGQSPDLAIAPDGQRLAYLTGSGGVAADRLHVRRLDQLTSEVLAEGELNSPFFSADGTSVGFYDRRGGSDQVLLRVSVLGGPVSTICDIPGGDLRGASWGPDGTIVFGSNATRFGLWRVPAVGGEPEQLTTPDLEQGEVNHHPRPVFRHRQDRRRRHGRAVEPARAGPFTVAARSRIPVACPASRAPAPRSRAYAAF